MFSYLAPLDHCITLIDKYIPAEYLSPPDGSFCAVYANIAAHLAQAYLCVDRSEEAKTYFYATIEFEMISQGNDWPSTETSLKLLQGLAAACHKSGDLEKAVELLDSALILAEKLYGGIDWRTAAISSRLKAVSERREVMLGHHKSVVIAATGTKLSDEAQQTARTQENAPSVGEDGQRR